ncbi:hypothetical protein [Dictyobacter formicarum]|uniref:Uncharacterized protein n=1 Tax=Dictyobacter formicarum TaxID=2778368 RepID=A0ABQ3VP62_9CHLR|nr:hypothetical protein [Dictyobacter formicarum]GHO88037.1 hypothetical protein KSZ_60430 [Dictyobacter formicarum]
MVQHAFFTNKSEGAEAFGSTCPAIEEVEDILIDLGFDRVFQMRAIPATPRTPGLPAQYHYRDRKGTEIIFLSGRDTPMPTQSFPEHAARWWIYPGACPVTANLVAQTLSSHWHLQWQSTQSIQKRSLEQSA